MVLLNQNLLMRANRPVKILQVGCTPRLLAGFDRYVQKLNDEEGYDGGIALAVDTQSGRGARLYRQDGRHTVTLEEGEKSRTVLLSSVERFYDPWDNYAEFMHSAGNPALQIVVSDTGENGIRFDPEDTDLGHAPHTYPALLAAFLRRRYVQFRGDREKGLYILPLEEIGKNGQMLKAFVRRVGRGQGWEEGFFAWLDQACRFYDTKVSVRAADASREEIQMLGKRRGYVDHAYVIASGKMEALFAGDESIKEVLPQTEERAYRWVEKMPEEERIPRIDLHCDTLTHCLGGGTDLGHAEGSVDLERLRESGALAQDFAVFLSEKFDPDMEKVYQEFQRIRGILSENEERYRDIFRLIRTKEDLEECRRDGKVGGLLSIEDGAMINGKITRVDELFESGVRLITLTWNYENCLGYPNSTDPDVMGRGLKDFGIEVVRRMNEKGMIVDVSHLSDGGFWDCVKYSAGPIVASHSNARALSGHPRNLTDEMIRAVADKGGVIGLNFCPWFLKEGQQESRIEDMVRHIGHIVQTGGIGVMALGTDFDGIAGNLQISDCTQLGKLEDALREAGYASEEIEKIFWKNAFRVLSETLPTEGETCL